MKRVILFLWFGDEKPPYIHWTLENFRKMNPGWEIRYIEYSNEQLLNYKDQDDPILVKSVEKNIRPHVNYIADEYRKIYLDEHKDELIMYCDLDCFPIAPFDNFLCSSYNHGKDWMSWYCENKHEVRILGTGTAYLPDIGLRLFKCDNWCLCNNKDILFNQFLQLKANSIMNNTLVLYQGMLMNEQDIPIYNKRNENFHNMNIKLGDNFCLPQFTPIEHYYSIERNRLNIIDNMGDKK